ncbi:MAG: hypothetical protein A2W35_06560 [Chloroflexi bacterium RBG_16_57_11]|nr:MAG: hypothetical protein A2W35_06560 [Chloroflexi bacterium RBG_16_57_11]HKZ02393.1 hypothetical protein [Pyrinomonadaceae bacterium]
MTDGDKASMFAYRRAMNTIGAAALLMGANFGMADAVVGPERSLRLSWQTFFRRKRREVNVIFAGSKNRTTYMYREYGTYYEVDENVTSQKLAEWLVWLKGL